MVPGAAPSVRVISTTCPGDEEANCVVNNIKGV